MVTAFYQFVKVQDPDNSSQTVYDSWIKADGSPRVSCNNFLMQ
jgi:N-acetylated-alpha-linked acidic dipeptidase